MEEIKVALVAHTENFHICREKIPVCLKSFRRWGEEIKSRIRVSWMLEEDDMRPYNCEIRSNQDGRVIEKGGYFFKRLIKERDDELGLHVHFTKGYKFCVSPENQERLIGEAFKKFVETFEFGPKSFVGGWWYSDAATVRILERLGFRVDASPIPLYREKRRRWLFGKIPTPFKVVTCDWRNCTRRTPWRPDYNEICKEGRSKILYVPNAVDPDVRDDPIAHLVSLDLLEWRFTNSLVAIRNFLRRGIFTIVIPFHPHSLSKSKLLSIRKFFLRVRKYAEIRFVTLSELKWERG